MMRSTIIRNLVVRFDAYSQLVSQVEDESIAERIAAPKHKSLGEHLWCVVGARESYAKALKAGDWSGFNNSMGKFERNDFVAKLASSAQEVLDAIEGISEWTPELEDLLVTLYEHEVMHEGQIIRHMYGFEKSLPESWKWA